MPQPASLFIASSTEALNIAEAITSNLKGTDNLKVDLWKKEGLFPPGQYLPDKLKEIATSYDFAALVFSPDDIVISRGIKNPAPRDNIIFELGLFAGTLGHERTFAVVNADDKPKLPVDFLGVTYATYTMRKDPTGAPIPIINDACRQIMQAIRQEGSLRNPRFDPALSEITENVRRALKFEHPLFLSTFERWCEKEKDASKAFGQGLLRIITDYGTFLASAFRGAEKNIFSTSGPALKEIWKEPTGRLLLQAQKDNDKAISSRVFVYQGEDVTKTDIEIMKLHQDYGVKVRVYEDTKNPLFSFDPTKIENQLDIIDDGKAIGVMMSVGPAEKREAYWYFDDIGKKGDYLQLRDSLIQMSSPLNEWLVQQPEAPQRQKAA